MTVVERRGSMGRECGSKDQFPVGMRVLAVDDDPTCLKLLETLLLRCQYHEQIWGPFQRDGQRDAHPSARASSTTKLSEYEVQQLMEAADVDGNGGAAI